MERVIKWSEKTCLFCLRTGFLLPWERKFKNGTSRADDMTRPNKTQMFELLLNASECFLIDYVLVLRLKNIVLQRLTHLTDESVIILTRHSETHGLFRHVLNSNRINAYPKRFSLTYVYGSHHLHNLYTVRGIWVWCNWRRWVGHGNVIKDLYGMGRLMDLDVEGE